MKIRPSRGYVLIESIETDEVSAGGVLLPERMKDMSQKGKVLAVGQSINTEPLIAWRPCAEGDTVIFKRFVDNRIKEEGKELLLVKFEDILGIYETT